MVAGRVRIQPIQLNSHELARVQLPEESNLTKHERQLPIPGNKELRIAPILLAVYWILLFVATHSSVPVEDRGPAVPHLDKIVHTVAFAILGWLMAWSCRLRGCFDLRWMIGYLAIAAYAVVDEWTQRFVEQRVADIADGVADLVGAALGMSLYCFVQRFVRRS